MAYRASDGHAHRAVAINPMRELLTDLRGLGNNNRGKCDAANRERLASNARSVMAVSQNGMAALRHLLAHSSPVIEDGTIGADSLESLGWLMAEVGDLAAHCMELWCEFSQRNSGFGSDAIRTPAASRIGVSIPAPKCQPRGPKVNGR